MSGPSVREAPLPATLTLVQYDVHASPALSRFPGTERPYLMVPARSRTRTVEAKFDAYQQLPMQTHVGGMKERVLDSLHRP